MGAEVHPTAIVHEGTVLGEGVRVLEYAVVGKQPVLSARSTAKREPLPPAEIGDGHVVSTGAVVFAGTTIGARSIVGDQACVRERCAIGEDVVVGRGSLVENDTTVGARTKIQAEAYVTAYSTLEEDVFIAPCVVTTNDNFMGRTEGRHELDRRADDQARRARRRRRGALSGSRDRRGGIRRRRRRRHERRTAADGRDRCSCLACPRCPARRAPSLAHRGELVEEVWHAHFLRGPARAREQRPGTLVVAGSATREQHGGRLELGPCREWLRVESLARLDRIVEMRQRDVILPRPGGEDAEQARDRTEAKHRAADDSIPLLEREQELVEVAAVVGRVDLRRVLE